MSDTAVFVFDWLPEAKKLLEMRDRFTRKAIQTEFELHPASGAVTLDAPKRWYATPVANNRYTVVWQLDEQANRKVAHVKAVVAAQLKPAQLTPEGAQAVADLKEKLEKVAQQESNGLVTTLFTP